MCDLLAQPLVVRFYLSQPFLEKLCLYPCSILLVSRKKLASQPIEFVLIHTELLVSLVNFRFFVFQFKISQFHLLHHFDQIVLLNCILYQEIGFYFSDLLLILLNLFTNRRKLFVNLFGEKLNFGVKDLKLRIMYFLFDVKLRFELLPFFPRSFRVVSLQVDSALIEIVFRIVLIVIKRIVLRFIVGRLTNLFLLRSPVYVLL
jgi:hypothetical protein